MIHGFSSQIIYNCYGTKQIVIIYNIFRKIVGTRNSIILTISIKIGTTNTFKKNLQNLNIFLWP